MNPFEDYLLHMILQFHPHIILLGSYLKLHPIVQIESVLKALKKTLPERHHGLIPQNEEAIKKGMELVG